MDPLAYLFRKLRIFIRRDHFNSELEEEMAFHREQAEREFQSDGMAPEAARYAARRQFGNEARLREKSHEVIEFQLETAFKDLRYAVRQLAKSPLFTLTVVTILALGMGANTAVFTVMNGFMLRLLPVRDPQRVFYLETSQKPKGVTQTGFSDLSFSSYSVQQLRIDHPGLTDLMTFVPLAFDKVPVRYEDLPEQAQVDMVSGNFFSGLGVRLTRGRGISAEDDVQHAAVAVLSYQYWTDRFARDPAVLEHAFFIKGVPFTIVGIGASGFQGVEPNVSTDIWIPMQDRAELTPWGLPKATFSKPNYWYLMLVGRLDPDARLPQVQARLNAIFQRTALYGIPSPDTKQKLPELSLSRIRGIQYLAFEYRQLLTILMAMVGSVLLISCSNIAVLLMARNASRERELGIRMAIGASRARIFRQLMTESVLLIAGGCLLAWNFARWASHSLVAWLGLDVPVFLDRSVLIFTLALCLFTILFFGLAPLSEVFRRRIHTDLRSSTTGITQSRHRFMAGRILVVVQTALCFVLLIGAGLLVCTLRNIEEQNLGMDASRVLVFGLDGGKLAQQPPAAIRFYNSVLARLEAMPGVESATYMESRPGSGWSSHTPFLIDRGRPAGDSEQSVEWNAVGPHFFRTLDIPLLLGRDISAADDSSAAKIAVVNETFVRRYIASRSPLGHVVSLTGSDSLDQLGGFTIVGVAEDNKFTKVTEENRPMAWFPYMQLGLPPMLGLQYALRTPRGMQEFLPEVRRAVNGFALDMPLEKPMSLQAQFESSYAEQQLLGYLASFFALLAASLVAIGLYGTLAFRLSRRVAEFGIRMALGAPRHSVLWMVMRESLSLTGIGIALGLPLAFASVQLLRSALFGLSPTDRLVFVSAMAGIALIGLCAGYLPALRAASIDPIEALRTE